jgi:ABC-2 type transport system permease protein
MSGTIFMEAIRRNWRSILFWGGGIAFLGWLQIIILPDVDSLQQMADLMETLPPIFLEMFGGSTDPAFLSTPEGYLNLRYFSFVPLLLSAYAIASGLSVTANEEDQGILDMVLSLPVPRWRIIVERFLAYSLMIAGILLVSVVGLWLGTVMTPVFAISVTTLLAGTFNMLPIILAMMAFTVLAGTVLRRRGQAAAVATAFVVGTYFLDTLGKSASENIINQLSKLSIFSYYDSTSILQSGEPMWGNLALLLVVALVLWAGAVWFFQRRDVGV